MKIVISDLSWGDDTIERRRLEQLPDADVSFFSLKTEEELIAHCRGAVAVLSEAAPFSRRVLSALPGLEMISIPAIGYDHVDLAACRELGIAVANVPGYCSDEVADHALALLLAINRSIVLGHERVKAGEFSYTGLPAFPKLRGQTLAIIGCGGIGLAVAARARAFGMKVLGVSRRRTKEDLAAGGVEKVELEEALARCDVLSLHLPADKETEGLCNRAFFALTKRSPILINTARGKLIVEEDLLEALEEGRISWAGLDVLAEEPPDWDSPLLKSDRVIFTPHYGFFSLTSGREVRERAADHIVGHFSGDRENIAYLVGGEPCRNCRK